MVPASRFDGRSANTLRPLTCELACLRNSDGSALWKSGSTHVLCSVQGPVAPRQQHQEGESAALSVVIKTGNAQNTMEYEWEVFLTQVLSSALVDDEGTSSFSPRCVVQVVLQILSADGSVLSACLHAAVSALMDAGITLKFLPTAATCLLMEENRQENDTETAANPTIQLDPSAQEEQEGSGVVVLAVVAAPSNIGGDKSDDSNEILAFHTAGISASMEKLLPCCAVAARASAAVAAFLRLAVEQKVKRESQTLWSN